MTFLSPQTTLLTGILLSIFIKNLEVKNISKKWSSTLLKMSVIFLGAALNFRTVISQGARGIVFTVISILFVFLLGLIGAKILKLGKTEATLITFGTAICGGSAIGALAPVISASSMAITLSMSIIFFLNAVAVFLFPFVGHLLSLGQDQFGLWAALAIHDTSSVVAACTIYGDRALMVGTTIKLTRALWIIPTVFMVAFFNRKKEKVKSPFPFFILGFISLSLFFTFTDFPDIQEKITSLSKLGFSITLFLIGLSFDLKMFRSIGYKPFIYGLSMWIIVSVATLLFVILSFDHFPVNL